VPITQQLDNTKSKVKYLLKEYPALRDCDKKLWIAYLGMFHDLPGKLGEEAYDAFCRLMLEESVPNMESIRRVRQKFQEEGHYLGAKRKARMEEAKKVNDWSRKAL